MEVKRLSCPMEIKSVGEAGEFAGYATMFGVVDSWQDIVDPGVIKKSIKRRWPKMFDEHFGKQIGKWLTIAEDEKGAPVEGKLLMEIEAARDAHVLMKAQEKDGLSIGYIDAVRKKDSEGIFHIVSADIIEISVVAFPANHKSVVTDVKSEIDVRRIEVALRDAGLSRAEAKTILASGWKSLRDADAEVVDDSVTVELSNLLKTIKGN